MWRLEYLPQTWRAILAATLLWSHVTIFCVISELSYICLLFWSWLQCTLMLVGHWPQPPQLQSDSAVTSSLAPASADWRLSSLKTNVRPGQLSPCVLLTAEMSQECPHGQQPPGTWSPASPMLLVQQRLEHHSLQALCSVLHIVNGRCGALMLRKYVRCNVKRRGELKACERWCCEV